MGHGLSALPWSDLNGADSIAEGPVWSASRPCRDLSSKGLHLLDEEAGEEQAQGDE